MEGTTSVTTIEIYNNQIGKLNGLISVEDKAERWRWRINLNRFKNKITTLQAQLNNKVLGGEGFHFKQDPCCCIRCCASWWNRKGGNGEKIDIKNKGYISVYGDSSYGPRTINWRWWWISIQHFSIKVSLGGIGRWW